jgi:hypothetical protein
MFISAIPIGFQIANKNKEALLQDIERAKFAENLRAELPDPSRWTVPLGTHCCYCRGDLKKLFP